jgi:L-histidine N-alpha-methyltransferase
VQYAAYSKENCLQTTFDTALQDQQNIVLQAGSLRDPVTDFARSVCAGLERNPRQLECRFLYDARGSKLYEQICSQPEYYPTRTEAGILARSADEICRETGPCHLIELGSGSSAKTDYLLSSSQSLYGNICYTPIDISASALHLSGRSIISRRPEVQFVGIHGTYNDSFKLFRCASPALVIFLGSTIGNFQEEEEHAFWQDISRHMQAGDYFLLGIDLVKDQGLLEAAYNDAAGVTAAFTRNYFARMNRELGTALDPDRIEHIAFYNREKSRMEIHAEFTAAQQIDIRSLGRTFTVDRGERILVEVSRKFRLPEVRERLRSYGFTALMTRTDASNWFGLLLLQKTG